MAFPREILNRLKWSESEDLEDAEITYIHRGAPGDLMTVKGKDIVELERSFFVIGETKIPYHRISKITRQGKVLFESPKKEG